MKTILSQILNVTNTQLNSIDLTRYQASTTTINTPKDWFYMESGAEHYRLLAFISTLFNNKTLLDIGTYQGSSSIALSYNPNNSIISFDINQQPEILKIDIANIKYCIDNILNSPSIILNSPLILVDTYHDGSFEREFINELIKIKYTGLVLFDDIHLDGPMQEFWDSITIEKYDLTKIGHYTGTGLLYFN